jgi:hypothetical protein
MNRTFHAGTARCTLGFAPPHVLLLCVIIELVDLKNSITAIIVITLLLFLCQFFFTRVIFSVHCFSFAHV